MKSIIGAAIAAAAGVAAMPALAQTVTANDPATVVGALEMAGYPATLAKDSVGDPKVETEMSDRVVSIMFYGCDEEAHDGCDQLQFMVGFDADEPMEPKQVVEFMDKWRFASVSLDDEGDPWLTWDVVTGKEGIPVPVFLQSVRHFTDTIGQAELLVWPS